MADTLTFTGRLVILSCWCGMQHAVPEDLRAYQMRQHDNGERDVRGIFCPLGHQHVPSGPGAAKRDRDRADAAERRAEMAEATARRQRERAERLERSRAALKGHLTRARKRIANGVCPVPGCHRSGFTAVMRHIAAKHPDWLHDHGAELA